jgi:signal transduction histidine kinase
MDAVRYFFELNRDPVLFIYGLVFFVMGLAIALQSRRHSRLDMARSMGWLAAFGLAHGLHEWGDIFIPIQATYLSTAVIRILQILQVVLLALSFGFLLQFGIELLRERWPRLTFLPLLLMVGWGFWFIMPGLALTEGFEPWHQQASTWARYLIGFPGGVLAAIALRYQADQHIKPLGLEKIYHTLRLAGLALLAYGLLGGLIVPGGDFFPANWLNAPNLNAWIGIPAPVFRSLAGLVMAITIIRTLEVFDLEVDYLIEQMEIEQNLLAERERIGRELHDGALQQVYSAGLLMEAAQGKLEVDTAVAGQRLAQATTALNEAIASLRAYMGELRPGPASISLADGLRQQTADPRLNAFLKVELSLDIPETAVFTPAQTSHMLAIVGEALSNAARHAQAHRVSVRVCPTDDQFQLIIEDDGRGFVGQTGNGYGLHNMHERARLLGGRLTVNSQPGNGTQIRLEMPLKERKWI